MSTMIFRNNENSKKYIEVRRYADGHYVWKQFIRYFAGTRFDSRYYTGCSSKRVRIGNWRRVTKTMLSEVLSDYTRVEG